jgi:hypothetical protein
MAPSTLSMVLGALLASAAGAEAAKMGLTRRALSAEQMRANTVSRGMRHRANVRRAVAISGSASEAASAAYVAARGTPSGESVTPVVPMLNALDLGEYVGNVSIGTPPQTFSVV